MNNAALIDHQFTSANQPRKRGRRRNVFGNLTKENTLSSSDVQNIFKNILATPVDELETLSLKFPSVLTEATITNLLLEIRGDPDSGARPCYSMIKYMIDRCFGKPVQTDVLITAEAPAEVQTRILQTFIEARALSKEIAPAVIAPQIAYSEHKEE